MSVAIDLRSDTVTKPCAAMRKAIASADVGDDVFAQDPTVNQLQERVADMLGKEAAILMPSGTMTNQIAVRLHCQPGDEFICEAGCHIYNYEQGAFAQLSGVVAKTVEGKHGVLAAKQFEGLIRPDDEHFLRTRMVCLENTHNRGGGKIQPLESVNAICGWAKQNQLSTHLDGARLFNAAVASGVDVKIWSDPFDTVSVCFSKGLGAPIGSALAGNADMIKLARRHRKLFGGGMRQAGIIASAALFALDHNLDRLAEDHAHAQQLAQAIAATDGLNLDANPETNIVFFEIDPAKGTASQFVSNLNELGILVLAVSSHRMRAVTHLGVTSEQISSVAAALEKAMPV